MIFHYAGKYNGDESGTSQTLLQACIHQRLNKIRNHAKTLRSAAIILVLG